MRAQVTGFAIIGVLAIIAISGLVWLAHTPMVSQTRNDTSIVALQTCIETKASTDIQEVGLAGGVDPTVSNALSRSVNGQPIRWGIRAYPKGSSFGPNNQLGFPTDGSVSTGVVFFPRWTSNYVGTPTSETLTRLVTRDVAGSCGGNQLSVTDVIFSENDVTIKATEQLPGHGPQHVTVKLDVPIKRYSEAMLSLLSKEAADPTFRVSLAGRGSDYTTSLSRAPDGKNEILTLTSDRPEVNGQPFVYRALIENRPPVFLLASGKQVSDLLSCNSATNTANTPPAGKLIDPDDLDTAQTVKLGPLTSPHCSSTGQNTYEITSSGTTYEVLA